MSSPKDLSCVLHDPSDIQPINGILTDRIGCRR